MEEKKMNKMLYKLAIICLLFTNRAYADSTAGSMMEGTRDAAQSSTGSTVRGFFGEVVDSEEWLGGVFSDSDAASNTASDSNYDVSGILPGSKSMQKRNRDMVEDRLRERLIKRLAGFALEYKKPNRSLLYQSPKAIGKGVQFGVNIATLGVGGEAIEGGRRIGARIAGRSVTATMNKALGIENMWANVTLAHIEEGARTMAHSFVEMYGDGIDRLSRKRAKKLVRFASYNIEHVGLQHLLRGEKFNPDAIMTALPNQFLHIDNVLSTPASMGNWIIGNRFTSTDAWRLMATPVIKIGDQHYIVTDPALHTERLKKKTFRGKLLAMRPMDRFTGFVELPKGSTIAPSHRAISAAEAEQALATKPGRIKRAKETVSRAINNFAEKRRERKRIAIKKAAEAEAETKRKAVAQAETRAQEEAQRGLLQRFLEILGRRDTQPDISAERPGNLTARGRAIAV